MEKFFIVRADRAGVFFGKIKENKEASVVMQDVRKIHYWERAAAVEQIAMDGIGGNSRMTVLVPEMEIANPIQVIPCSEKSVKNLQDQKVWKM